MPNAPTLSPPERVRAARILFRQGDSCESMTELALAFHSLEQLNPPGLQPWVAFAFLEWGQRVRGRISTHEFNCLHFVLSVWNLNDTEKVLGPFDAMRALTGWDRSHAAAFAEWVRDPWWP